MPASAPDWGYYPVLRLYAPNNSLVASCSAYAQCEFVTTVPATGTYLLTVSDDDGGNTGTDNLLMQRPNNPANTVPLTFGVPVNANIENGADLDTYTFTGTAGDLATGPDAW